MSAPIAVAALAAERIERADHRLVAAPGRLEALLALGFGEPEQFDDVLRRAKRVAGGRAPGWLIEDPLSGERIRLRAVRRGGGLAPLLPSGFATADRAERELALWLRLRARGAPLPEPVAALARRRGALWQPYFASLDHANAVDGLAWLEATPDTAERTEVVAAFARALRRLHDAGAVHGDLHLRNVLIESTPSGTRCLFVDLDHAVDHEPRIGASPLNGADPRHRDDRVPAAARVGDWMRVVRSLEKHGFEALGNRRRRASALAIYCGGDRRLRAELVGAPGAESWRHVRHRLAWRLQNCFAKTTWANRP